MKRKALSLAIAAAAYGTSGATMALDLDPAVGTPDVPDFSWNIAGATAPQRTLQNVIAQDICQSGTVDIFEASFRDWLVFCTVPGRGDVVFRKSNTGSGTGTSPVDNASTAVRFFDGGSSVCTGSAPEVVSGVTIGTRWTGCGTTAGAGGIGLVNLIPDFGISDVEPAAFQGPLAPLIGGFGGPQDPFQDESAMDVRTLAGLGFGVVATTRFYQALQADQFPVGHDCHPASAAYNTPETDALGTPGGLPPAGHVRGLTEQCMPTVSKAVARSIMAGTLTSNLNLATGTGTTNLFVQSLGNPWASTSVTMRLCRRVSGSGTHAQTAIHHLRTGCGSGEIVMATGCDGGVSRTCGPVVENQGSGDLSSCMNAAEAAGVWALGYHSLEKNGDLAHDFRWVKIDGVAPTLANQLSGEWENFGEVTMQRRGVRTGQALATAVDYLAAPANAADATAIFDDIVGLMSSAAAAEELNNDEIFRHPFGNGAWGARPDVGAGVLPSPQAFDPVTGEFDTPVNALTHVNPATGVQNTCYGPAVPAGAATIVTP